jgi:acyl-CoA thioester hydrolase
MSDTNMTLPPIHRATVRPEWIDYNGHMNVGYYVLAFDHATDAWLDRMGLGDQYRKAATASTFVVEAHVTYQNEVGQGVAIDFTCQLLGFDAKRLHLFLTMRKADDASLVATSELMLLHVDMTTRRTAPIPDAVQAKLSALEKEQASLPRPKEAGRVMAIKKA